MRGHAPRVTLFSHNPVRRNLPLGELVAWDVARARTEFFFRASYRDRPTGAAWLLARLLLGRRKQGPPAPPKVLPGPLDDAVCYLNRQMFPDLAFPGPFRYQGFPAMAMFP